jgi:hypothetical protein
LLDTNLLLLLLVAQTDARILQEYKRVQSFTYQDIELLRNVLQPFQAHVTTPHILSETSNFLKQAPSWRRAGLGDAFKSFINEIAEIYEPAENLIVREEFNEFGLADTGLAQLSSDVVVITVDYPLSGKIEAIGGHALNFNHYRSTYLLSS